MMRATLLHLVLIGGLLATGPAALAQPANPFTPGSRPPAEAAQTVADPGLIARIKTTLKQVQSNVHRTMNSTLAEIKENRSSQALTIGIVFAFLYGAFHAAGPGHGKAIVVSYFLSRHSRILRGFVMGAQISFMHVLSAIAIIVFAHVVLTGVYGAQLAESREIKYVSYGLIFAIGAFMLLQKLTGWFKHSHDHDHHHHHDDEIQDHVHHHYGHHHGRTQSSLLSVVVGMVPCSGSILILVYALANGILLQGLIMTLFIAIGMTITMACLGMLAIVARDRVLHLMDDTSKSYKFMRHSMEILGPLVIMAAGTILLMGV